MQKVMVFGTFDVIHPGHKYFLKKAKRYGHLIVVVARDMTVKQVKGRFPQHMEQRRLSDVKKLDIADEVILGKIGADKYKIIEEKKPDIIVLGYDQQAFTDNLRNELRERGLLVEIVRIRPYKPHKFKSSKLK